MKYAYATYLGTQSFLPGVITLYKSLKKQNSSFPLVVLVSTSISMSFINYLKQQGILVKSVKDIPNPYSITNTNRLYHCTFTKLRIFDLTEYKKIIFLDADLIICNNIDSLFESPHLSAVTAGSLIPKNNHWKEMNTGVLVVEPNKELFKNIESLIGILPSKDGSDQGFLHSYYEKWPNDSHLHLPHHYNVPFCHLYEYCDLPDFYFSYDKKNLKTNISIVHYWDMYKPWQIAYQSLNRKSENLIEQSLLLWWDTYLL